MSWFDFKVSDHTPVPITGRLLIEGPPTTGLWDRIRTEPVNAVTWLIQISEVLPFLAGLPDDMKPATQNRPTSGLPKNVWVGGPAITTLGGAWPEILDVRARIRFLIIDDTMDLATVEGVVAAWRCANCGRRGIAPRPKYCPHSTHLCGDAKILPQIHWVIDQAGERSGPYVRKIVESAGVVYWPQDIPDVE